MRGEGQGAEWALCPTCHHLPYPGVEDEGGGTGGCPKGWFSTKREVGF